MVTEGASLRPSAFLTFFFPMLRWPIMWLFALWPWGDERKVLNSWRFLLAQCMKIVAEHSNQAGNKESFLAALAAGREKHTGRSLTDEEVKLAWEAGTFSALSLSN